MSRTAFRSVRRLVAMLFVFMLTSLATQQAHVRADPFGLIGSLVLKNALDDLAKRLDKMIADATANGDYLVEKNARMLAVQLENVRTMLANEVDKTLDRLSAENQKIVTSFNDAVARLEAPDGPVGKLLDLEDFLAIDLQKAAKTANPSPLAAEKLMLRRIDGYSQVFRPQGVYTYRVIGTTFGVGYRERVLVNGREVPDSNKRSNRMYVLEFDVPVGWLNEEFKDRKTARIDLEIVSFEGEATKPAFTHRGKVLLLPRFPVAYTLTEHRALPSWSADAFWSDEGSAFVARTGQPTVIRGSLGGRRAPPPQKTTTGTASATIPDGCLMLKDTVTVRTEPADGRGEWDEPTQFTNADRTVSRTYCNREGDKDRKIFIKVQYRKPAARPDDRAIEIRADDAPRNRLSLGTYFVDLSPGYQSFDLTLKYFNGREVVLSPTHLSEVGAVAGVEERANFKRMRLDLKWPEASR
jgi:hypothetical protein